MGGGIRRAAVLGGAVLGGGGGIGGRRYWEGRYWEGRYSGDGIGGDDCILYIPVIISAANSTTIPIKPPLRT